MRTFLRIALLFMLTSLSVDAQRVGPAAFPPVSGTSNFSLYLRPAAMPQSLQNLCDKSLVVVDAQVQSTFLPRIVGEMLETDVVLGVNQVLKGPASIRTAKQIVVTQIGGKYGQFTQIPTQYPLMQPNERYILFLTDDTRQNRPDRGMPRQDITGTWVGMFRVDNEKVHPSQSPLQQTYEGTALAQALIDISSCVQPATQRP